MNWLPELHSESLPRRTWWFLGAYVALLAGLHQTSLLIYVFLPLALMVGNPKNVLLGIYLLILIPCLNIMNNVFFVKDGNYALASKLSVMLLCVIFILHGTQFAERKKALQPFYWLVGYAAYMIVMSPLSIAPLISALKAVLFVSLILALMQATKISGHGMVHAAKIRSVFLAVAIFFVLGSLVTMFFPAIGHSMMYSRKDYFNTGEAEKIYGLFNGVTFHSQALGPALAMLNGFLLADYVFNLKRKGHIHLLLLLLIPVLIYQTSSRTAMFSYLASVLIVLAYMANARRVSAGKKSTVTMIALLAVLFAIVSALIGGSVRTNALAFLTKQTGPGEAQDLDMANFGEQLTSSRMNFIYQHLANFTESPLFGIGFQVTKDMKNSVEVRELGRLLSAPVEKGFTPTVILEEGGILGVFIFLGFLISVYAVYTRLRCFCFLSTFSAFLATNCGESTLFSISSIGGFGWMLCFGALQLDLWLVEWQTPPKRFPEMQYAYG
ncbi:MAG: O-antigen ligase family protein [Kiritimatiellia bacterium]